MQELEPMKRLELDGRILRDADEAHALIKEKLGFPAYYGGNLSGPADCLQDLTRPVRILITLPERSEEKAWFRRIAKVIGREAEENEALHVEMRFADEG